MQRQRERKQLNRLAVKPLDQVFIMRAKEGMGCSQFEAQALTDLVKEGVDVSLNIRPLLFPGIRRLFAHH